MTLATSAFADNSLPTTQNAKSPSARAQTASVSPFWADDLKGESRIIIFPGGDPEVVPQGGPRADPCALGEDNSYDRPGGNATGNMAPYGTLINGDFNLDQFYMADDFTPSADGRVSSVCWRGLWSDLVCAVDANPSPHLWFINFYAFDTGTGLPGALITSFSTNVGGRLSVAEGVTGLPVGINPVAQESSFRGTLDTGTGTQVDVLAGTCYYVEIYASPTNPNCFFLMGLSYEANDPVNSEGNRSHVRRNNRVDPNYLAQHFQNIDMQIGIGFVNAATELAPSNGFGSCFDRPAPSNDLVTAATTISCGGVQFPDTTYAQEQEFPVLGAFTCRKSTIDLTDYTSGTVWYTFSTPLGVVNASASLCASDQFSGLAGGDSLMAIYRKTVAANPVSLTNLTLLGCSDDACSPGLSQVNVDGLTPVTVPYYIRISSFTPIDQGQYQLNLVCPIPIPANDLCTGAIDVPANTGGGSGFATLAGVLMPLDQTRAAAVDGDQRGCAGNTARGVWYKLTGRGFEVNLSTDNSIAGVNYDNMMSVYCGTCSDPGAYALNCVAANDDLDESTPQAELNFCAKNGVTYYILINGFGSATGDFQLFAIENRDGSNNPIACCDPQICDEPCSFEIPANAITENGENAPGEGITVANEPCFDYSAIDPPSNATNFNDGCNLTPPGGEDRRYALITTGQIMTGTAVAVGQQRDADWILFEGMAPITAGNNQGRTIVQWNAGSEGPMELRYWNWGVIFDFSDCAPALGFAGATPIGCDVEWNAVLYLDSTATAQNGTLNGRTLGWRWRNQTAGGEGYPCGTTNRYWLELVEAIPFDNCAAIANPAVFDDETTQPTFDGTAGNDGFVAGEICVNPPGAGSRRKEGCFAPVGQINDGEFLRLDLNEPMVGVVDGNISTMGGSRDVDFYKFTVNGGRAAVGLKIECSGFMSALITEDNCAQEGITYAIAATRGTCVSNGADADDLVVLNGGGTEYQAVVFATDAFVGVGSGASFGNYRCQDGVSKYILTVTATPLPDCSATPVCTTPNETEPCVTLPEDMFDTCGTANSDNDGCSRSKFKTSTIALPGSNVTRCGTLYSVYEAFPDDVFSIDQDYWTFTVGSSTKLTVSLNADGPARLLVLDTGAPSGVVGAADEFGGSNCYDDENPVRVMAGLESSACTAGPSTTIHLEAGTYSLVVAPGNLNVGVSFADYPCSNVLSYSLTATTAAADVCALQCNSAPAISAGGFTSIVGLGGTVQVTGLGDDDVVTQNLGAAFGLNTLCATGPQAGIASNGYIVFHDISDFNTLPPRAFPNAAAQNSIIAPFWHDWDVAAPGAGVYVRTTGSIGSEVTVVQWNNVARHENWAQRATFQVILDRSTNPDSITFCYGPTTNLGKLDLSEVSAGYENASGLSGNNLTIDAGFRTGNRCISFCAVPVCCEGNADKISPGQVNFADVTAVLSVFNNPANPNGTSVGDADCNGFINFADVTSVLGNFLDACP